MQDERSPPADVPDPDLPTGAGRTMKQPYHGRPTGPGMASEGGAGLGGTRSATSRVVDFIDHNLQRGTIASVLVAALATLALIIYAVINPDYLHISIIFVLMGMSATWREYHILRRKRDQHGIELIGTSN
jgi:hypothetical protein